ncbi:MAG: peptidoglycan-associated lipoprotein Pal [Alphaproteobacteria bacterium]|nr:peptidoglycan-associated lipoprotein Pal [Alphaproteobacteria bacterium]
MALRFLSILAALLLVAACETTPEQKSGGDAAGGATASSGSSGGASAATSQTLPGPRPGSAEDFVVNVGDRVFFDFDKYNLKPKARETLQRQAAWLKRYPSVLITVEGHCDERGTREYNLALGERRANSAKNYLVALGVNPNRVRTISYGKERPAVAGSNEAAWAQNRRSVTVVRAPGT